MNSSDCLEFLWQVSGIELENKHTHEMTPGRNWFLHFDLEGKLDMVPHGTDYYKLQATSWELAIWTYDTFRVWINQFLPFEQDFQEINLAPNFRVVANNKENSSICVVIFDLKSRSHGVLEPPVVQVCLCKPGGCLTSHLSLWNPSSGLFLGT